MWYIYITRGFNYNIEKWKHLKFSLRSRKGWIASNCLATVAYLHSAMISAEHLGNAKFWDTQWTTQTWSLLSSVINGWVERSAGAFERAFQSVESVSRPFFPACAPSRGLCDSSECCPLEMALRKKLSLHTKGTQLLELFLGSQSWMK